MHQVLDLSPGYSAQTGHQVDRRLFALLVDLRHLLVQHDALSPFSVVSRAVRENRDERVLNEVHPVWPSWHSRCSGEEVAVVVQAIGDVVGLSSRRPEDPAPLPVLIG